MNVYQDIDAGMALNLRALGSDVMPINQELT